MTSPQTEMPPDASADEAARTAQQDAVRPTQDGAEPAVAAPPTPPELSPTIRRLRAVRALLWALVGVMAVAWLFYAGGLDSIQSTVASFTQPAAPAPVTTADIGQAAPGLKLPLVGGGEVDLAGYKGRPVILTFWATWCDPCRAEMPVFERAQQQYRDQGLAVLGVDFQEQDPQIQAFLAEIGVTFPSMVDRTGEVARQWRATGLPTTFLIDRQGIIQDVRVGAFTDDMLQAKLAKLVAP
jgi:thiol-disulfide isomerase/thioredoxin